MKYFTFQQQFHAPILACVKRSTIRPSKKLHAGERFALRYWMFKPYRGPMGILGTATCCQVGKFIIGPNGMGINDCHVDEEPLALQEGFRSANDMRAWFLANHGEVFEGWIHVWTDFRATTDAAMPANSLLDGAARPQQSSPCSPTTQTT